MFLFANSNNGWFRKEVCVIRQNSKAEVKDVCGTTTATTDHHGHRELADGSSQLATGEKIDPSSGFYSSANSQQLIVNGSFWPSASYSVNSQSFESMSFSEGVIKGNVGSWNYQFYLKDHLGSTRMALTDDDKIACATMYQPYGTMADVDGISAGVSDPVRQRFTTKEFDEDGDVNSASGIGLFYFGDRYYDADLGRWISVDPKKEFWDYYRFTTNPMMFLDPNGLADIYIFANIGRAQTSQTTAIEQNLQTLANRYRDAGYDVVYAVANSTSQLFIDALNDGDAQRIFYVGHGAENAGISSIGFDDGTRFAPDRVNNTEYENPITASNTDIRIDVASCSQNRDQWVRPLPNTRLDGGADLVRSSERYRDTPITPQPQPQPRRQ
jgi:RHS repeat-associated protein